MAAEDMTQLRHVALASPVRRQILGLLRGADGPLDAAEIGRRCELHVTTARFHLDQLETAALIARQTVRGVSRGRPRVVFSAVPERSELEPLRALSGVLADAISHDPDGGTARARAAGRKWADAFAPTAALDPQDPVGSLKNAFGGLGFEPELVDAARDGQGAALALHGCPFRDTARAYPGIVCAAHAGLVSGLLDHLDRDETDASLAPFVEPELCMVRFPGSAAGPLTTRAEPTSAAKRPR